MKSRTLILPALTLGLGSLLTLPCSAAAFVDVITGHSVTDADFKLDKVPPPAVNDAAAKATFTLVSGEVDPDSGGLKALNDGKIPHNANDPKASFSLKPGAEGGRVQVDLGSAISIKSIGTYSWHAGPRAPQVYKLYAADGTAKNFNASPGKDLNPISCGWTAITQVDTRPAKGEVPGQYAAGIVGRGFGAIGSYRYLLFDIASPNEKDSAAQTLFSEIDVVDANGPAIVRLERIKREYKSADGKYVYVIDAGTAPDLMDWSEKELLPVVREWYPKMAAMLPSDDYAPPARVLLQYKDDLKGTPAYATGAGVSLNDEWFRHNLKGEARGCVIHELVHVVQNYGVARTKNPHPAPTPGWVIEGIPDYIRWFLYEPQSHGAGISPNDAEKRKYNDNYRISANFIDWVVRNKDKNLIVKLNAAGREGRYNEGLWKEWTGMTIDELAAAWTAANKNPEKAPGK